MGNAHLVLVKESGVEARYPLKPWLRANPDALPGVDPSDHTSHQLRARLRSAGWRMEVDDDAGEVRLIPPVQGDASDLSEEVAVETQADASEDAADLAFELEHQLRDFIAANLSAIDVGGRRLSLFRGSGGRSGIEFQTDVGFIDILAQDESGALFVFELKRADAPDKALGQLARYMGWVKQSGLAPGGVHGVIMARNISVKLRYAVEAVPNVHLFEYELQFALRPAPRI